MSQRVTPKLTDTLDTSSSAMLHPRGWLLLPLVLLVLVTPAEYSSVKNDSKLSLDSAAKCKRKTHQCGPLQPPQDPVGHFQCKLREEPPCEMVCTLICPLEQNGLRLFHPSQGARTETYACSRKNWKKKESLKAFCTAQWPVKEVSQNLRHVDELNGLTNRLLNTSYVYLTMLNFYERADVALFGFSELMKQLWEEETSNARQFMSYINKRGGFLTFQDIPRPYAQEFLLKHLTSKPGLVGLQMALRVTRDVNELALRTHSVVIRKKLMDPHLKYFLEDMIISQKTKTIKRLSDHLNQLSSYNGEDYDIGEYLLDLDIARELSGK